MISNIKSYDDLLLRKRNLENLLQAQKELIKLDFEELKMEANKYLRPLSSVTDFLTRDKKSWLLGIGANTIIDLLVKKVILSRAGWVTRLIVPFFIKNYSSHFIAEHQDEWAHNLVQWLTKSKNGTDKEKVMPEGKQQ
jgi:hypothetical protein